MSRTRAVVSTQHASRYLQQLSKHWAHKFETEFTPITARIALPLGETCLKADETSLLIELTAHKSDDMKQLQDVVQVHIERFAFREALAFVWGPAN